jgi:predicted Zn-ribbon and HTH transcriptional regulator
MKLSRSVLRIPTLFCERCTHTWQPRQIYVSICPRCKSKLWHVPPRTGLEKWRYKEKQKQRILKAKKGGQ